MIAGRRSFTKANHEPISAKDIIPLANTIGMAVTAKGNLRVLGFLIATALFFGVTLLSSLFAMIILLNQTDIPRKDGPSYLMIGLVPPSIATFFLYTKVFGRFL